MLVKPLRPEARVPRPPLTRTRILEAAFDLCDEVGLDGLSMRRLGSALGVQAMSLYNHVANKDDVLDGLADLLVARIELPAEGEDWRSGMQRRAHSARRVLNAHPWGLTLIESRGQPGPALSRYYDATLGCLRRGGFPVPLAAHALAALDAYIFGFALQEHTIPVQGVDEITALAAEVHASHALDAHPWFAEMVTAHVLTGDGFDYAAEFDWGLELILDGLARRLESAAGLG